MTSLLAERDFVTRYADIRSYTSQAESRLEVIASDDDPLISQALGDRDYHSAIELLTKHYSLIVVDTGTGILDSAVQGVIREADQIIVVMPPALDGARVAAATLDWLDRHGHHDLVENAVAVINAVRVRRAGSSWTRSRDTSPAVAPTSYASRGSGPRGRSGDHTRGAASCYPRGLSAPGRVRSRRLLRGPLGHIVDPRQRRYPCRKGRSGMITHGRRLAAEAILVTACLMFGHRRHSGVVPTSRRSRSRLLGRSGPTAHFGYRPGGVPSTGLTVERSRRDAAATASTTCDNCTGKATTVQVIYLGNTRRASTHNVATAWSTSCRDCVQRRERAAGGDAARHQPHRPQPRTGGQRRLRAVPRPLPRIS